MITTHLVPFIKDDLTSVVDIYCYYFSHNESEYSSLEDEFYFIQTTGNKVRSSVRYVENLEKFFSRKYNFFLYPDDPLFTSYMIGAFWVSDHDLVILIDEENCVNKDIKKDVIGKCAEVINNEMDLLNEEFCSVILWEDSSYSFFDDIDQINDSLAFENQIKTFSIFVESYNDEEYDSWLKNNKESIIMDKDMFEKYVKELHARCKTERVMGQTSGSVETAYLEDYTTPSDLSGIEDSFSNLSLKNFGFR